MQPASRRLLALAGLAAACYLLLFYNLAGVGMLGPDEPRYAAIGREMARSGDWITPRLAGQPWFEKPPLLYWMTAAAFRAGLGEDLAPRLPVALLSAVFLFFFWRLLAREFGPRAAWFSTAILGTSAAWLAFSHAAVPDLPMAATFSLAMLLALGWLERGERSGLVPAAALLGAAVLAKGLVPLVLALPLLWMGRHRWRDLLRPAPLAAFLVVALPWHVLISLRYGTAFLADLFWKHHFERFTSPALQHVQPFWFYLPVFVAALFPWSALLAIELGKWARQTTQNNRLPHSKDPRRRFLAAWVIFGLVFFSAAENKLPGYLLPLLPAAAVLLGLGLSEAREARWGLASCAALLAAIPVLAGILPAALERGLTHAGPITVAWPAMIPAFGLAALVWFLDRKWALAALVAGIAGGLIWLEARTFPILDRSVSARGLAQHIERQQTCVGAVNRGWRYGLDYYQPKGIPDCAEAPRPFRIEQREGEAPELVAGEPTRTGRSAPPHLVETSFSVF